MTFSEAIVSLQILTVFFFPHASYVSSLLSFIRSSLSHTDILIDNFFVSCLVFWLPILFLHIRTMKYLSRATLLDRWSCTLVVRCLCVFFVFLSVSHCHFQSNLNSSFVNIFCSLGSRLVHCHASFDYFSPASVLFSLFFFCSSTLHTSCLWLVID